MVHLSTKYAWRGSHVPRPGTSWEWIAAWWVRNQRRLTATTFYQIRVVLSPSLSYRCYVLTFRDRLADASNLSTKEGTDHDEQKWVGRWELPRQERGSAVRADTSIKRIDVGGSQKITSQLGCFFDEEMCPIDMWVSYCDIKVFRFGWFARFAHCILDVLLPVAKRNRSTNNCGTSWVFGMNTLRQCNFLSEWFLYVFVLYVFVQGDRELWISRCTRFDGLGRAEWADSVTESRAVESMRHVVL